MNFLKRHKAKILLATFIFLLLPIGISVAQVTSSSNPCKEIWHTKSPKGVTYDECDTGLHYPTFNAYRDSGYLGESPTTPEFEFAWVRDFVADITSYNNQTRYGYVESLTLNQPGDLAETYFYIHNSGDPECNTQSDNNSCGKSTIADNVKFSLSSFEEIDGKYISRGIVVGNQRQHTIQATISSSNTTPPRIQDEIIIRTNSDQFLELDIDNEITFCQPNTNRDIKCRKENLVSNTLTDREIDAIFGNGLTLNSSFRGSNQSGYFASEGYRSFLQLYFFPIDAPDEELVCEGITATRVQGTPQSTTQTYRVTFTPNETEFHQAITVSGAQSTQNFVPRRILPDYTVITFSNLTPSTTATITSAGNGPNCQTSIPFDDIPGPRVCRELNLLEVSKTEDSVTFEVETTPADFASLANVTAENGSIEDLGNNRYRLAGIDETTTVRANIPDSEPGSENCLDEEDFTPEPPALVCEAITLTPTAYDYTEGRPNFRVDSKTPSEFQADFRWRVIAEDGTIIEEETGRELLNFTPTRALTGFETVTVEVINSDDPDCRAEVEADPKPTEVCEDLDIIRILNPQLSRTIPSNGQPAIFQLDGGDYEGQITFESDGPEDQTVFITNDQIPQRGSITVDIDETVIILNTAENNTIRVFAQEQNANTVNCNLLLRANSDDPGDKITELDKTVDKAFATDGDILTYRITYTISPIFGNPEFAEALEGIDSAIIRDNITQIVGIQDTFNNPLTAEGSRLEILDVAVDGGLPIQDLPLLFTTGYPIEDLTEKAGRTYTFTYTARLVADIIDECQIITNSCGFEFPNTASDNFGNSDTASVIATCPFVVSRSFGDVFLEEEFEGTIDIARCTNRRNTDGTVFTPKERTPQELISSGSGAFSAPTHRICRESISANPNLDGRELEGYRNPLEAFSSSVCEVALFTSASWTSEDIERNLRSNASRFQNVTNLNGVNTLESLNASNLTTYDALNPNSDTKVYRKTNGNLTISADSELIVNDGQAKTIIVEGHDLIIDQNIKYQATNSAFPSQLAFIVIGGDVVVSPEVTDMVGAIAAVPDANGNGGFIRRSEQTTRLLTIRGSLFGDSAPLFAGTNNPGNLLADQGAVTVIYDSGIILNTPPGLQSIIQFNQYQTVR